MSLRFEKLTDRTQIECTRSTRAFARWFEVFFSNMASKNCRKYFFRHFFFIWPKIHIYAKNEVYRSKNEKKALLACTLPLRDLSIESEKKNCSIYNENGSNFTIYEAWFHFYRAWFHFYRAWFHFYGAWFHFYGAWFHFF